MEPPGDPHWARDLVLGGGLASLPIGEVFLGGAVKGSLARTFSLVMLVMNIFPVVWAETSIPSCSKFRVSLPRWAVASTPSIISRVVLMAGSSLKPGMSAPSILLPVAGPGQASDGTLDCPHLEWNGLFHFSWNGMRHFIPDRIEGPIPFYSLLTFT